MDWLSSTGRCISATLSQRIGISCIEALSRTELDKPEREVLLKKLEEDEAKDFTSDSDSPSDNGNYCEKVTRVKKKSHCALKTKQHFFEHNLSKKEKGTYQVWKANVKPLPSVQVPIYLHAVNDSKPVYRISNRYAARASVRMIECNRS